MHIQLKLAWPTHTIPRAASPPECGLLGFNAGVDEPRNKWWLYDEHEVKDCLKRPLLPRLTGREERVRLHLGERRIRLTDELDVAHLWAPSVRAELTQLLQDASASTAMMTAEYKFKAVFDTSGNGGVSLKVGAV